MMLMVVTVFWRCLESMKAGTRAREDRIATKAWRHQEVPRRACRRPHGERGAPARLFASMRWPQVCVGYGDAVAPAALPYVIRRLFHFISPSQPDMLTQPTRQARQHRPVLSASPLW